MESTVLIIAGAIATIGGCMGVIGKYLIGPIRDFGEKIELLKELSEGQKIIIKSQADTLQHIITGNHQEKLQKDYEELIEFCINK